MGQDDSLEKGIAPTPVFLPGEFHGQRSLVGCSPWGLEELDTTELTNTNYTWHVTANSWSKMPAGAPAFASIFQLASKRKEIKKTVPSFKEGFTEVPHNTST